MDNNTQITIKAEIVGQGAIFPCPFSGAAHAEGRFPPEGYTTPDPLFKGHLHETTDFTFIPEKGWKCSGGVYLRPLSQKAGRTPEYAWGRAFSIDSLRTMKGGDNMADGTPRFHLSIGPEGVARVNGNEEHILRVEFVPDGSVPPSYNGPTLEDMTGLAAKVADHEARLTKAGL